MSNKRTNDVRRTENLDNASTSSKCNSIQNTDPDIDAERTKGMTFRDLQVDERFKKLERVLKLSLLNKIDGKKMDRRSGLPMPAWSISSINSMDLSSTAQSLNTSCMCSEVVTSSANLKKTLLDGKRSGNPLERMATSSLKNSPMTPKNILDTLAMPPPSMYGSVTHSSKEKSNPNHGKSKIWQKTISDADNISSITAPSTSGFQVPQSTAKLDLTVPKAYHNHGGYAQGSMKESQRQLPTVFYRWKVILNDQGQLLIKGTLENNRVAHSKPVIRRLTSTSVESILKHTYHLEGNIVDDRHDLPDYIRGKFYNGFPEDWENVHQIWRCFIAEGCKPTFRWPTPITDSDDDLISEVTDVIFMSERDTRCSSRERERSHTSVRRDSFNTSIYSNSNASVSKERTGSIISATPTIPTTSAVHVADISSARNSFSKREEYTKSSNSSIAGTSTSSRLEDKLTAIITNLADRNCSQEYIEKVTVMFDCLNYVVNYNKANDENQLENFTRDTSTTSAKNQSQRDDNRIPTVASSNSNYKEQNLSNSKTDRLSHSEYSNTAISRSTNIMPEHRSKDAGQSNSKRDVDSESESETYSGVPRISADKILRVRNLQERPSKHYVRKPINDFNTSGQKRTDKVLTVNLERVNNIPATNPSVSKSHNHGRDNRKLLSYDSSVSILENPSESETHNGAMCQPHKQTSARRESVSLSSDISDIENDPGILNGQAYRESKSPRDRKKRSSPVVPVSVERSRERTPVSTLRQNQKTVSVPKDQNQVAEVSEKVPVVAVHQPVAKAIRNMENKKNQNSDIKENETSPSTSGRKSNVVLLSSKPLKAQKTLSPPVPSEKAISPRKKTTNNLREKTESANKDYGSKTNPKILAAWTPLVVYNPESESKCGLIFEGNLLNEAGHVANKKFNTDLILRRVSSKVVETVGHEFFHLSGDLKDTKHVIPKELIKQCRSGCPAKINQFCDNWKSLKTDNFVKNIEPLDGSTLNVLSIPTSSRGRRILPPLNYWNGERITFKDNNPVYSPGKTRDTYETSRSTKSRTSFSQDSQDEGKQKNSTNERVNSCEGKQYPATDMRNRTRSTSGRLAKTETKKSRDDEDRKSIRKRRRIIQQLNFSSSDEDEKNCIPRRRTRSSNKSSEMINGKKTNNSSTIEYTADSSSRMRKDALGNSSQKSKMAKRQKLDNSPRSKQSSNETQSGVSRLNKQRSTTRNPEQNIICTYYKNVPLRDNILSDDETSQIA